MNNVTIDDIIFLSQAVRTTIMANIGIQLEDLYNQLHIISLSIVLNSKYYYYYSNDHLKQASVSCRPVKWTNLNL